MAERGFNPTGAAPYRLANAVSPSDGSPVNIVERAAAILGRQTPAAAPPSRSWSSPSGIDLARSGGVPPIDELRQRAMDLVNELFAYVAAGNQAPGALPAPDALATAGALLPWRSASAPVTAGSAGTISFYVENQDSRPVSVNFYATDLVSDNGSSIPSYQIAFAPPVQVVGPRERAPINVNISVPLQVVPGSYSGLVQATGLSVAKAVITIEVR